MNKIQIHRLSLLPHFSFVAPLIGHGHGNCNVHFYADLMAMLQQETNPLQTELGDESSASVSSPFLETFPVQSKSGVTMQSEYFAHFTDENLL